MAESKLPLPEPEEPNWPASGSSDNFEAYQLPEELVHTEESALDGERPNKRRRLGDSEETLLSSPGANVASDDSENRGPAQEAEVCGICLEELSACASCFLPECGHTFHVACLISALRRRNSKRRRVREPRCPFCRQDGSSTDKFKEGTYHPADEIETPRNLRLQLFSEIPLEDGQTLPYLHVSEVRSLSEALGKLGRHDCVAKPNSILQSILVFGRDALTDSKLSEALNLKLPFKGKRIDCRSFISRELFYMQGPPQRSDPRALVDMAGISNGLYLRRAQERTWQFKPEGDQFSIWSGDSVALIFGKPHERQLESDVEEICLLGVQVTPSP